MSIFTTHLQAARRRLMWPTLASLDFATLSEYSIETIDELILGLNNTKEPHLIQSAQITVDPDTAVYSLDGLAPNYGKARYLWTEDESNLDFRRTPISLVSPEDLTENYNGGDPASAVVNIGVVHTALAASVYYSLAQPGPGWFIEFAPIPKESAQYRLTWEPNVVRPSAKGDTGFHLDQFDMYVGALSALRALPHAQWKGLSRAEAKDRRGEIRETLNFDIGSVNDRRGYAYLFWMYRQSTVNRTSPTVTGWASDRR